MMLITLASAAALVLFLVYYLTWAEIAEPGLPRVGKRGLIGYLLAARRFKQDSEEVLRQAWDRFSGRPFILPTFAGSFIILGPEHMERIRKSDDTVFNQPIAVSTVIQTDYTFNSQLRKNPYHTVVIGTDVTRAISSFIPEILEETELAMRDKYDRHMDAKPVQLPVFDTLQQLIARITTRVILGTELCRNEEFIQVLLSFNRAVLPHARWLRHFPRVIRPIAHSLLSSYSGGQKRPIKFIISHLEQLYETNQEKTNSIVDIMTRKSDQETLEDLAVRVLSVNFAGIHTTSLFLSQALFELAVLPEPHLESMRTEVTGALEAEGGWNKAALARFRRIDSLLREIGRFHGLSILSLERLVTRDEELEDGTRIPAGYFTRIYTQAIHFDPKIYPNPHVFDAFRFLKLREDEGSNVKHGFTTINNDYISFGVGRHACPGRFFVAMVLKVMISHLILNYDISLPAGVTERPKNIVLEAATIASPTAELVFKRRSPNV